MTIKWKDMAPGERAFVEEQEDGSALFALYNRPDWVLVPGNIEHEKAGERLRISGTVTRTCLCGNHTVEAWVLGDTNLRVVECREKSCFYTYAVLEQPEIMEDDNEHL